MQTDTPSAPVSRTALIAGWIISLLPALALVMSAAMKLMKPPEVAEGFPKLGWSESAALGLGLVELGCVVLYLFPRTAFLGAILLTGYLGGAAATHVRLGEQFFAAIIMGVLIWLGLLLRDARVRALLPWRREPESAAGGAGAVFGKVVLTAVVLVLLSVGLIAATPAEFKIERSITIAAPPAEVFAQVNDFHRWDAWNPWEKMEPTVQKTYEGSPTGTGAVYKWKGQETGEGRMTIIESRPNERVRIKLDFIEPFKATNETIFTFQPAGDKTVVTWTMQGRNELQGKVFNVLLNMDKTVGGQFDQGLAHMKAAVESSNR